MRSKADRHDRVTRELIMKLKETLDDGADVPEIMVIGESFLVGIALLCIRKGADVVVLEDMFNGALDRLEALRKQEKYERRDG